MSRLKRDPLTLARAIPEMAAALSLHGFRHALIGGVAVGVWVEPRATKDIDFVVGAKLGDVEAVLHAARNAGFSVDAEEVERLKHSYMTRVWASDAEGEPFMIDLLLDEHPFYGSLLARGRQQLVDGKTVSIASVEDLVLMKVLAARPRDIADVSHLIETHGPTLDREYLQRWAEKLDITDELAAALDG